MSKFLVIQTAFIGDVVLATALIEKLHLFYPEATIDFLVRKGNESLLSEHPFISEVLIWNKKENKYKNLLCLLKKIRQKKYDAVINIQRFAATGMLSALSNAKIKIGFDKNPWSFLYTKKIKHQVSTNENYLHEIERNQQLIEELTDSIPEKPRLYPSLKDYQKVEQFKKYEYICIAPASVWFTKQYPEEKWVSLANNLPNHFQIYLLGAPGDVELCERIKNNSKNKNIINLAGKLNFLQSAALQKDAVMNYVNDSAPMHFASAVNAPVTAIYCSTVPSFGFGPLSDKKFIVQTKEALSCKPCGLHGYKECPLKHFKCAHTILDEQLLQSIQKEDIRSQV